MVTAYRRKATRVPGVSAPAKTSRPPSHRTRTTEAKAANETAPTMMARAMARLIPTFRTSFTWSWKSFLSSDSRLND